MQNACQKAGPKKCFHPSVCAARNKECVEVEHCEAHGPTECDFPRKCLGEVNVCKYKDVCVKERKDCKATFSTKCISCATNVKTCQQARETADKCGPACEAQCKDDNSC